LMRMGGQKLGKRPNSQRAPKKSSHILFRCEPRYLLSVRTRGSTIYRVI
jgi:hypothetical protein